MTPTDPPSGDRAKCVALADRITGLLRDGIQVSSDIVDFIDATLSPASIDQLTTRLEDKASEEAETILELLFFPDETFQIALEPILQECSLQLDDLTCLLTQLHQRNLEARFIFPVDDQQLVLKMPKSGVASFVSRLNIAYRLPSVLLNEIKRSVPPETINEVLVILRNCRICLSKAQTDFLCIFFPKMAAIGYNFYEHLRMVLQVMDETDADITIYEALMKKKRTLLRHMQDAIKFEEKRRYHAMEILMLGGERAAHIHPDDALRTIALIDATAITVFGSTETMSSELLTRNIGPLQPTVDMKSIMALFESDPPESE